MNFTPIVPTTLDGKIESHLLEKAEQVCIKSAKLLGGYNKAVIRELVSLLRIVNCYYSNRIESEGTHPIHIEKAMKEEYLEDTKSANLQKLALAYIDTELYLEQLEQNFSLFSSQYLKQIHKHFYSCEDMDKFLTIQNNSKTLTMIPGDFREESVKIGHHIPVMPDKIEESMKNYEKLYSNATRFGTIASKLIYTLASHHRLVWIHPFLDGNGRISRLVLDSLLHHIGIEGYGLWNISRGLARTNDKYKSNLALADELKYNDYDGRGNLSNKELTNFVEYMLNIALDQIEYMTTQLQLSTLTLRIEYYVKESQSKMYHNHKPLPKHSETLLKELIIKGSIKRGEVQKIIGTKDRVASSLIKELIERNYITSDTPRGDIRIKFNTHFAMKLFPELVPEIL